MNLSDLFSAEAIEQNVLPFLLGLGGRGLRFLLLIALAAILSRVLSRAVIEIISRLAEAEVSDDELVALEERKRRDTLMNVAGRAVKIAVWAGATVMALSEIGFEVGPLLAGAGVAGIAVGFGAQNLIRDYFAGFFLLIENQIRVGDVAVINGQGGLVEQINLRTTVLRDLAGDVHIFPNGGITQLSNKTREYSYYVFDIGVAYKEDTDHVAKVMEEVAEELRADEELGGFILEPIQVLGLERFSDSAVVVRARIKTVPNQQWAVGRAYNRLLKKRFDAEDIEFPFPHRTVFVRYEEHDDALRKIVREEMGKSGES